MTHYEELGLPPNASPDEIHEAYKRLARLLHPDTLQDDSIRALAETQMKRLNAIHGTLANPLRRCQYDQSLKVDGIALPPPQQQVAPWRGPTAVWTIACLVVAGIVGWAFVESGRSATPVPVTTFQPAASQNLPKPEGSRPAAAGSIDLQAAHWRRMSDQLRAERDAALVQVSRLESRVAELAATRDPAPTPPNAIHQPRLDALSKPDPVRGFPIPAPAAANSLAGTWIYIRSASPPKQDLYPPDFIETMIMEDEGVLHGRYRARFRVADRAISPDVAFHFSGKGGRDSARLPFWGAGGARGEVRIRMLTANSIEVAWLASDLGTTQGLGSGTALLVRRRDPQ